MDFSAIGGAEWGTDQIYSNNYGDNTDLFMTHPVIKKELSWPVESQKYPNPPVAPRYSMPVRSEGFINSNGGYPPITENMLIILLLVILIVLCTMIYTTVKQTCDTLKLMTSMMAVNSKK